MPLLVGRRRSRGAPRLRPGRVGHPCRHRRLWRQRRRPPGVTRALALAGGQQGIRVNTVCIGAVTERKRPCRRKYEVASRSDGRPSLPTWSRRFASSFRRRRSRRWQRVSRRRWPVTAELEQRPARLALPLDLIDRRGGTQRTTLPGPCRPHHRRLRRTRVRRQHGDSPPKAPGWPCSIATLRRSTAWQTN